MPKHFLISLHDKALGFTSCFISNSIPTPQYIICPASWLVHLEVSIASLQADWLFSFGIIVHPDNEEKLAVSVGDEPSICVTRKFSIQPKIAGCENGKETSCQGQELVSCGYARLTKNHSGLHSCHVHRMLRIEH